MAATWPLIKAMSEGKTVQARYRAGGPNPWVALTPQESINFDIRVCEYRIKEDLAAVLQRYVTDALLTAYKTSTLGELDRLRQNVGSAIERIVEESK